MRRNLALAGMILGWGLIVIAGFVLIWDFVMLCLLLTGRIAPNEPVFFDDLAPTMGDAVIVVVVESVVVAAGFVLKRFAGRYTVGKSA